LFLAKALFYFVNFFAVCISATDRWSGFRPATRVGQWIVNRRETRPGSAQAPRAVREATVDC
jgi:hypothetical protein